MAAVCEDWQQVFQMLSLIVWVTFSDTDTAITFVHRYVIAIDPRSSPPFAFLWAICWWGIRRLHTLVLVCLIWSYVCVCVCTPNSMCAHATHLIACGSLFVGTFVNSKEILLDLPLHLFCVMSLPAMCCSLSDWQAVIKKSNTWPHLHRTDETRVSPYQKQY